MAFVNINAMAESRSFRNMVWYLTVKAADGTHYPLIQYIETVDLKFLRKGAGCPDQLWPHVDANTLHRASMPDYPEVPTPAPTPAAPTPAPFNTTVPCTFGTKTCKGNQCCPAASELGGKTYPCPSAEPGWNKCDTAR